jgi:hypothetical protein
MSKQPDQISNSPLGPLMSAPDDAESKARRQRLRELIRPEFFLPKKKAKKRKRRKKVPTPEEIAVLKRQAATAHKYLGAKRRRDEAFKELAKTLDAVWNDVTCLSSASSPASSLLGFLHGRSHLTAGRVDLELLRFDVAIHSGDSNARKTLPGTGRRRLKTSRSSSIYGQR